MDGNPAQEQWIAEAQAHYQAMLEQSIPGGDLDDLAVGDVVTTSSLIQYAPVTVDRLREILDRVGAPPEAIAAILAFAPTQDTEGLLTLDEANFLVGLARDGKLNEVG